MAKDTTLSVLVIDSDRSMKSRFEDLLRMHKNQNMLKNYTDYELHCAYTVTTGLRMAREEKPYLIILATSFNRGSDLDGIEQVLKPLKYSKKFTGKIFCWSYSEIDKIAAMEAGADAFIKKDKGLTRVRVPIDVFLRYDSYR